MNSILGWPKMRGVESHRLGAVKGAGKIARAIEPLPAECCDKGWLAPLRRTSVSSFLGRFLGIFLSVGFLSTLYGCITIGPDRIDNWDREGFKYYNEHGWPGE